jgi:hypothetical protein
MGQGWHRTSSRIYTYFYGKWNENHVLNTGCYVHKRITSAVKRVEFVSDRMSHIVLSLIRGCRDEY